MSTVSTLYDLRIGKQSKRKGVNVEVRNGFLRAGKQAVVYLETTNSRFAEDIEILKE